MQSIKWKPVICVTRLHVAIIIFESHQTNEDQKNVDTDFKLPARTSRNATGPTLVKSRSSAAILRYSFAPPTCYLDFI